MPPSCGIMYSAVLLVLIAHLPFAFSLSASSPACDPTTSCWLTGLHFAVNSTSFPSSNNSALLTISNVICQNLTAPSVDTTSPAHLQIRLAATNAGLICSGSWSLQSASGNEQGTFQANGTVPQISFTLTLITNASYDLVSAVESACTFRSSPLFHISFTNDTHNALPAYLPAVQGYLATMTKARGCDAGNAFFEQHVMNLFSGINDWLVGLMGGGVAPGPPQLNSTAGLIKFTHSPVVGGIDFFLNDVVGANGPAGLNVIIDKVTHQTGQFSVNISNIKLPMNMSFPPISIDMGLYGSTTFYLKFVNLSRMDSFRDVELFVPAADQLLDFTTVMDDVALSISMDVVVSTSYGLLNESVVLSIDLADALLYAQLFLGMSAEQYMNYAPSQKLAPRCVVDTISYLNVSDFNLSFAMENIAVRAHANAQPNQFVNTALTVAIQGFAQALPQLVTSFVLFESTMLNTQIVGKLMHYFTNHSIECPAPKGDAENFNQVGTVAAVGGVSGGFIITVFVAVFIAKYYSSGPSTPLSSFSSSSPKNSALLFHSSLPVIIRYGLLILLFANIALFVSSNCSLGASVYGFSYINGVHTQFPSLFDFSLVNTIRDMWNAQVYALAILILLFSGVWPYVKLVLLVGCWVLPSSHLSVARRENVLLVLDALGKWSLIDTFVLMMMMVAFQFSLAPPASVLAPAGSMVVQAFVEPHYGFYSFLVGTMLSLVLTHVAIKLHQMTLRTDEDLLADDDKEALWAHAIEGSLERAAYVMNGVTVLIIVSFGLLGFGISINAFSFEFKGAFGYLLEFLGEAATVPYSVISLGMAFPNSSLEPNSFGIRFIQVSFMMFAVVMPIGYLASLLVLWLVPMTYKLQTRLFTLTSTIHAWSAVEVFVVAVIAALLELRQFAQFIIGDKCDLINKYLDKYAGTMLDGDNRCFDVIAKLESGCWVMFTSCLIFVLVGSLLMRACHKALQVRAQGGVHRYSAVNG